MRLTSARAARNLRRQNAEKPLFYAVNFGRILPIKPMSGMMPEITLTPTFANRAPAEISRDLIISRVKGCSRLPSLRSIDSALRELLNAEGRYTTQISEIIR